MKILDTNVLSALMRPIPDTTLQTWLDQQAPETLSITAITVAELCYGIARLPTGQRRSTYMAQTALMFDEDFAGRILPFDADAAMIYAQVVACRERLGRPISQADAQIAAICIQQEATLITRNIKDFESLDLHTINPFLTP